jgi:hypothetical protein
VEQCSGCRFWLNWDSENSNLGECHRYPPRMATVHRVVAEGPSTTTIRPEDGGWPLTSPDDWCGEFQPPLSRTGDARPASAREDVEVGPGGI